MADGTESDRGLSLMEQITNPHDKLSKPHRSLRPVRFDYTKTRLLKKGGGKQQETLEERGNGVFFLSVERICK